MSITILTGSPGHGKSYTSIKLIDEFVSTGKFVVTNVAMRRDWALHMARRHTAFWFVRKRAVQDKMELYETRVHICEDISEITRVRFTGKKEGRGKVIVEEAHRHMNVRAGKGDEKEERKAIVNYASGHRHYGGDMILITQAFANLDLQIRNLFEFHSEVRNLAKLPIIGFLIKILVPGHNLFIRKTVWNDRSKTRAGLPQMYGLSKSLAQLYDTHSLEDTDWPADAIILPKQRGESSFSSGSIKPSNTAVIVTPERLKVNLDDVSIAYKELSNGRGVKVPRQVVREVRRAWNNREHIATGTSADVLRWIGEIERAVE